MLAQGIVCMVLLVYFRLRFMTYKLILSCLKTCILRAYPFENIYLCLVLKKKNSSYHKRLHVIAVSTLSVIDTLRFTDLKNIFFSVGNKRYLDEGINYL